MSAQPARLWWSASEIADARLPDLPATKRRVNALIEREGWTRDAARTRRRKGQGGGWEYHWTLLPSRAQAILLAQASVRQAPAAKPERSTREEAWAWYETLPDTAKAEARRRLALLQLVEGLTAGGVTLQMAVAEVAGLHQVGARTLWTWRELVAGVREDDRLPFLAPRHRAAVRAVRRTEVDPRFGDLLKADVLRDGQPSITSCYDRCVRIAQAQGIPTVPLHTARRWLKRTVSPAAWTLGRKGVEALKRMRPAQARDKTALHAMEAVNADYHRFDVFVRFPATAAGEREEVRRPLMVAIQDIHSGRLLGWRVDRTATSEAVQLAFGEVIERWGIPEHVLLDNGREFAAKAVTGGTPTRFRFRVKPTDPTGLLTSLGCRVHFATPYHGQAKPIERAFRDLCDRVAKHPAFQGAYTGNRPDAKPESYGSAAVPLGTFLAVLEEEVRLHNAREGRRSEVAWGRSFASVFDESYAVSPIRKATPEQRRLWLMGAEGLMSNRTTGALSFMGNRYHADWLHTVAGTRVVARFDRAALWDGLHVYSMSDEYLGHAPCIEKTGFFDIGDARATAQAMREWKAAARAELEAARRYSAAEVAGFLPPVAAESQPTATVIRPAFDKPKARAAGPARPASEVARVEAAQAAVIADLAVHRPARAAAVDDDKALFVRARDLERRIAGGETVTKEQQVWLAGFQGTPAWRTWSAMVADFGEDVLAG